MKIVWKEELEAQLASVIRQRDALYDMLLDTAEIEGKQFGISGLRETSRIAIDAVLIAASQGDAPK